MSSRVSIDKAMEDPFWDWCSDMVSMRGKLRMEAETFAFYMTETCSSCFAIKIDEDGIPSLGVHVDDVDAFTSVPWKSAALLRNHRGANYLALSVLDIGVEDSEAGTKVPLRIFLPIGEDKIAAFEQGKCPDTLRIRAMKVKNGVAFMALGNPRQETKLTYIKKDPPKAKPGKIPSAKSSPRQSQVMPSAPM